MNARVPHPNFWVACYNWQTPGSARASAARVREDDRFRWYRRCSAALRCAHRTRKRTDLGRVGASPPTRRLNLKFRKRSESERLGAPRRQTIKEMKNANDNCRVTSFRDVTERTSCRWTVRSGLQSCEIGEELLRSLQRWTSRPGTELSQAASEIVCKSRRCAGHERRPNVAMTLAKPTLDYPRESAGERLQMAVSGLSSTPTIDPNAVINLRVLRRAPRGRLHP
jgi:hypothetical protein